MKAIKKCDLPANEKTAWRTELLRRDRMGFIGDRELKTLRTHFEKARP